MRAYLIPALLLSLGGCAVTSETPLFKSTEAAAHGLAQGRWVLHGPGCDVAPHQSTPDCAIPFAIEGNRMIASPESAAMGAMGALGPATGASDGMTGPNEFLLIEGDPEIMQLKALPKPAAPGDGASATPPGKPGQRSYMAFRPLHQNEAGKTDRGILWLIVCPKDPAATPGFRSEGPSCQATTAAAVREQARHVAPLFSFFMTWVGGGQKPGA